jgi:hypothetical protein
MDEPIRWDPILETGGNRAFLTLGPLAITQRRKRGHNEGAKNIFANKEKVVPMGKEQTLLADPFLNKGRIPMRPFHGCHLDGQSPSMDPRLPKVKQPFLYPKRRKTPCP